MFLASHGLLSFPRQCFTLGWYVSSASDKLAKVKCWWESLKLYWTAAFYVSMQYWSIGSSWRLYLVWSLQWWPLDFSPAPSPLLVLGDGLLLVLVYNWCFTLHVPASKEDRIWSFSLPRSLDWIRTRSLVTEMHYWGKGILQLVYWAGLTLLLVDKYMREKPPSLPFG